MSIQILTLLLLISFHGAAYNSSGQFAFDGFAGANLALDGAARVASNGLLVMTNGTTAMTGHALHPFPLRFREPPNGAVRSFSTAFVFAIVSPHLHLSSHGMAFFVSPTRNLSTTMPFQYLGLLHATDSRGSASNRVLAVELDTVLNYELADIDNNHVGIDVDSVRSVAAASAGYYDDEEDGDVPAPFRNVSLFSRDPMQVWVDYDGRAMELDVTLAPMGIPKPKKPLLSHAVDLSTVVPGQAYIGFSASTGLMACSHYVLGWSFSWDGAAPPLDVSRLPSFPRPSPKPRRRVLAIALPVAAVAWAVVVTVAALALVFVRRRIEHAELHEDWEAEYEAHRFPYKDLFNATDGFAEKRLVGKGGCGEVYKGVLPRCDTEVAVKRVSNESMQGPKEFVAEVASMGRLKHRYLVQLLGYCRRKGGELFLVYEYMPNGSLDKYLHDDHGKVPLSSWDQRFQIIKGIASALFYLHEEGEQVVVHRDIKASNVLLDGEMNGRLGDFGLARLCDRGAQPNTTGVVGTTGYLSPELVRTGEANTSTDVFAYGAFLLEVACGRRPIETSTTEDTFVLVDSVLEHWHNGSVIEAVDSRLVGNYNAKEVRLTLELGLLCSHPLPSARPSMRQVVQYLYGGAYLPELLPMHLTGHALRASAAQPFGLNAMQSQVNLMEGA